MIKQIKQKFKGVTSLITENDIEHIRHVEFVKTWHEIHMLDNIALTKRTGNIIDIGANVGQHSVFFATHCTTGNIFSFEPNHETFYYLIKNIADNNLKNIYPFLAAIGNPGMSKIKKAERSGISGVSKDGDGDNVLVMKLFDFGKTDLIKIDVEGMEVEVLNNCIDIIEKYLPEIYIETFDNVKKITNILEPFGYTLKGCFNNAPTYWLTVN